LSGSRLILVVDDDEVLSETTATVLRHSGYRVRTAANGLDALYLLEAESPALVILDLLMPVLDGWEMADELHSWGADIPLLVVSGAGEEAAASAQDIGAMGFLSKPFDLSDLLARVDALVARAA
jgi:DNA-binding response OmpR family regulator